ncbi:phasin family protein [Rugamonas sp.]|uniref:phasin family protein n=1 Tax=Rugamonas sp. TaxID=1926287 RepID=UPI0025F64883|nr:phasin family protein [Rugamonas sp.]
MYTKVFTPAIASHCNVLLTYYTDLSRRMLDSAQRIGELHLQLARDLMGEWAEHTQRLLAARDAATLGATVAERGWLSGTALRAYQQGVADVYAHAHAHLAQTAETHLPAVNRSATALAEELIRNANEEAVKAGMRHKEMMERIGADGDHGSNGRARAGDEQAGSLPH